jgi:hypothetical protein
MVFPHNGGISVDAANEAACRRVYRNTVLAVTTPDHELDPPRIICRASECSGCHAMADTDGADGELMELSLPMEMMIAPLSTDTRSPTKNRLNRGGGDPPPHTASH